MYNSLKEPAIICDLDGTLCNTDHRNCFIQSPPKDWDAFYGVLSHDTPYTWCYELIRKFSFDHTILFLTARPEQYRVQTEEWLINIFSNSFKDVCEHLYMRNTGDYRKDAIIKEELYHKLIEPSFEILFCLDDRRRVVDMWRSLGLVCLHCADGDF